MVIEVLRTMTSEEVHDAVAGFSPRYAENWTEWLVVQDNERCELFGRILRIWQATRPNRMRRPLAHESHGAPFLEDLLLLAGPHLTRLGNLSLSNIATRSRRQTRALTGLWNIFSQLPVNANGSCVGITKAVLLLTEGRIGPALDSRVRRRLHIDKPTTSQSWVDILVEVAADIDAFEHIHGPLQNSVPGIFANLEKGRLYDMALGPR